MDSQVSTFKLKEIKIEVTHKCPLICIHCSSDATPSCKKEISKEKCVEIITEAIKMGVHKIAFSGGEPLLWHSINEVVETASSSGADVTIYTSGNVENVEDKLKTLMAKGLHRVILSLYSPDKKQHERITRIDGSFNKTIYAIQIANALKLKVEIHFVALSSNYKLLRGIAELGKSIGVSKVSVLRFVPQGRGTLLQSGVLDRMQNLELRRIINDLRNEGYDIRTGSPLNFLMVNNEPECLSAINRLIVDPDLRIFPCDAFKNIRAEEIVGTLKMSSLDESSLRECWQRSPYFEAIRNYLTTEFEEPCKSCKNLKKCLSGCLAQKVISNGTLKKDQDPSCLLINN